MLLGQLELLAICAALLLAATAFGAGRFTRRSAHQVQLPQPAAESETRRALATRPSAGPWSIPRQQGTTRQITQWLTADEIAVLYVHDWRKNGDTASAALTHDIDADVRNFCEKHGIALLFPAEIRDALLRVPGVSSRRERMNSSNPRHAYAIQRAAALGLTSHRYVVFYCTRKAPPAWTQDSDRNESQSHRTPVRSTRQSTRSQTGQRPVTTSKADDQGDLLIGHAVRRAA